MGKINMEPTEFNQLSDRVRTLENKVEVNMILIRYALRTDPMYAKLWEVTNKPEYSVGESIKEVGLVIDRKVNSAMEHGIVKYYWEYEIFREKKQGWFTAVQIEQLKPLKEQAHD